MNWIKRDFFPVEMFKSWCSGKVYEYESRLLIYYLRKEVNRFKFDAYRWSPSYKKAITIKVAVMLITQNNAVSWLMQHTLCERRNKTCCFQEGPLGKIHYCLSQEQTEPYRLLLSFSNNVGPFYARPGTSTRSEAANHTTLMISVVKPSVKSNRIGSFRDLMLISKSLRQAPKFARR